MPKKKPKQEMMQVVVLTLSDGTTASFTGAACCYPGDNRTIKNIEFAPPEPLPEGCKFEPIK